MLNARLSVVAGRGGLQFDIQTQRGREQLTHPTPDSDSTHTHTHTERAAEPATAPANDHLNWLSLLGGASQTAWKPKPRCAIRGKSPLGTWRHIPWSVGRASRREVCLVSSVPCKRIIECCYVGLCVDVAAMPRTRPVFARCLLWCCHTVSQPYLDAFTGTPQRGPHRRCPAQLRRRAPH